MKDRTPVRTDGPSLAASFVDGLYHNRAYSAGVLAFTEAELCRYGGLTQRAAAKVLGMRTGVAVSCQLRRLIKLTTTDKTLKKTIRKIETRLNQEQQREKQ